MQSTQDPQTANTMQADHVGTLDFKYQLEVGEIDGNSPLIYKWLIQDTHGNLVGVYIGKAKYGQRRPTSHYARNVSNALAGKPYRKNKASGFRKVHLALVEATKLGHKIELHFVCNVDPVEIINHVEKEWIEKLNCKGIQSWQLNG